MLCRFVVQVLEGFLGRAKDLIAPIQQLPAEVGPLVLAHKRLVLRGTIIVGEELLLRRHENCVLTHPFRHWALRPCSPCRLAHVSATPAGQPRIYGSESTSQGGSLDLTTARPGASRAIANRSHFEWIMAASPAHLVCGRGLKRGLQSREPWARCSQPNAVFGGGSSARPAGLAQSLDSRDAAAVGERPWYGFLQPAARISGLHARQNISPGEARRLRLALHLAEPWIGSGKVEVPIVVARAVGVELHIGFENLAA